MELTEPSGWTVGEIRAWLDGLPDDAILVVDDEGSGFARRPVALNGPWRLQEHSDGGYDYWQDNQASADAYVDAVGRSAKPFDSLPLGVLIHPR